MRNQNDRATNLQTKIYQWQEPVEIKQLFSDAQNSGADYLIFQTEASSPAAPPNWLAEGETDIIVCRPSAETNGRRRLSQCLPLDVYLLAVRPSYHSAVAVNVKSAMQRINKLQRSVSIEEYVVQQAHNSSIQFTENTAVEAAASFLYPALAMNERERGPSWIIDLIQQSTPSADRPSPAAVTAFHAGLFLINGFFDESHSCSQSIEGLDADHTGDYWHAILHRREPDYGNSKYWFRHVGSHPIFRELAIAAITRFEQAPAALQSTLVPWKSRLVKGDKWDPFAFVDLCAAAEANENLSSWCQQLQYEEMLLLLEHSGKPLFAIK